jgi:protease-4
VTQTARRVADDSQVGAVVVHVNSPGGSATASESMHAALRALAGRKPVVVAMGAVAASGGYYVSTPARPVFAQPGTLTGSIGVVAGKVVLGGMLERIGVHVQALARGQHTLMESALVPFSEEERRILGEGIERTYDLFLQRVAEGRAVKRDALEPMAGGRVWTGRQALERGLVDEMGGLEAAIRRARALGGLPERAAVRIAEPPRRPLPPLPNGGSALAYGLDGLRLLFGGRPALRCPLVLLPPDE